MEKSGGFRVTTPERTLAKDRSLSSTDWRVLFGILAISMVVRLYGLAWPSSVVFDEVHFGGFARKYIIGRFFFDVHPPLAKMLYGIVGWLGGFDGEFDFKNIGDDYIAPGVPYVTMRLLPSLCGIATILLAFTTLRASGCRTYVAAVAALMLTLENTHATESRYILLDSPLVFFVALSAYAFKKFCNEVPFQRDWYRYMLLTGLALGATVSSKWVGLFTIGWVGTLTVYQLWWIWGDLTVSWRRFWAGHFATRLVLLLGVPLAFYMGMFYLHFFCVDNTGDGADFMSRAFQSTLKHNSLPGNIPADVSLESVVSLRHLHTNGGYLHSHPSAYETGSKQQQVTLYPHVDENNLWRIENGTEVDESANGLHLLHDGAIIRLMHVDTDKRLHSHDHRAPVTTHDYINEVSGYGFPDFEGDPNDNWRVKIIAHQSSKRGQARDHIQALRTVFQLEHTTTGCLLYSKPMKLPSWGFDQQEVSCIRQGKEHNTLWFIEHNEHPLLDDSVEHVNYETPSFLSKFWELNKVMWDVNKGLTEPHTWESRPESWLFLRRGINMWGEHHSQVYLVGNLPIYWAIAIAAIGLGTAKALQVLIWQRKGGPGHQFAPTRPAWQLFDQHFGNYLLGWAFHYFPSFLMVRQLFLHHYLASVYFGVLMLGQALELAVTLIRPRILAKILPAVALTVVGAWYLWYSPLIYGKAWTRSLCEKSKFFEMDFDCNIFLDSYDDYANVQSEVQRSMFSARLGLTPEPTPAATEPETHGESEDNAQHQPVEDQQVKEQVVVEEVRSVWEQPSHEDQIAMGEYVYVETEPEPTPHAEAEPVYHADETVESDPEKPQTPEDFVSEAEETAEFLQ